MHRQGNKSSNRLRPSLESVREQREGRPYCPKCQQFFKHKDTVWVGHRQCRCPVCGELLERRVAEENRNGEAPSSS